MKRSAITTVLALVMLLSASVSSGDSSAESGGAKAAQSSPLTESQPYAAIKAALEEEWAIDNHTHIVYGAHYDEKFLGFMPLAMRQAVPEQLALAKEH